MGAMQARQFCLQAFSRPPSVYMVHMQQRHIAGPCPASCCIITLGPSFLLSYLYVQK